MRSIWVNEENRSVISFIDQRFLPHFFLVENVSTPEAMATAIKDMHLRGAPLIGVAAAYGVYLAAARSGRSKNLRAVTEAAIDMLMATRPTAVNLAVALKKQREVLETNNADENLVAALLDNANAIAEEEQNACRIIGEHGLEVLKQVAKSKPGQTVHVMLHCNAGWLAAVDYGTATSPVYKAAAEGMKIHVWVSETRPRLQGANLTAWELNEAGISHTVVADSACGYLMKTGQVDLVLSGADRIFADGDVINKIGTYMKALAAADCSIPFYVAAPLSTFDFSAQSGDKSSSLIESRPADEVRTVLGKSETGLTRVLITPEESPAANPAFDLTPARLISGIITERGLAKTGSDAMKKLWL
jgi:methylthioribose-1-phosphate isomerase